MRDNASTVQLFFKKKTKGYWIMVGSFEGEGDRRFWSFADVQEEIVWAVDALDRHVPSGRSPYAKDGPWALVIRDNRAFAQHDGEVADYVEPETDREVRRRFGLRTAEVERMQAALKWVEFIPDDDRQLRKLVGVVAMLMVRDGPHTSWLDVRRMMRSDRSPDALRMRYSRAITMICKALNRKSPSFSTVE